MSAILAVDKKDDYKGKKIGIPRALNYYKFFPFWVELLEKFGCEIVLTPETTSEILKLGNNIASMENCVPLKVFFGHVQYLIDNHPDLDYIFIPRYISLDDNHYSCPYFIALPDLISSHYNENIKILEWEINSKNISNIESAIELGKNFGFDMNKAGESYVFALNTYRRFTSNIRKKKQIYPLSVLRKYKKLVKNSSISKRKKTTNESSESNINLIVLGYPYNLYDPIINSEMFNWLNENGISIITIEHLPKEVFKTRITLNLKHKNYYGNEEEILQAARYLILEARNEFDGILFVSSTGCVCDALLSKIMERDFLKIGKPFLTFTLDGRDGSDAEGLQKKNSTNKILENFIKKIKIAKS